MPASKRTYKIRISPDRTLGPLDMERITALVMKGRVQGDEPTSAEPFSAWQPFSSFPELSELILKKLEADRNPAPKAPQTASQEAESAATKTMVRAERTRTMAVGEEESEDYGMPTLVDIKAPPPEANPDLEATQFIQLPAVSGTNLPEKEEGTRILTPESMNQMLEKYVEEEKKALPPPPPPKKNIFGKTVDESQYVDERTGKRRLLSRNTAALLALGLLLTAYLTQKQEVAEDPNNLRPRYHTFPYVEVNVPPKLGIDTQAALSADLAEKGLQVIATESPSAYMKAIREHFYVAVGRNLRNYDARALLASSYMRLSEIVPRDERLFETIDKLLFPAPPQPQWTPDFVVAVAEYYQMLNRFDQAQEAVDAYLKKRPTPELLYQKAKIAYERREIDQALTALTRAIPPEKVQKANPRHLLLYINLLEKKGQRDAVSENLRRLVKESPGYGPGLLYYADFLAQNNKLKEARTQLRSLLQRPHALTRPQLADSFAVAARVFEGLHGIEKNPETGSHMRRALMFAEAAEKFHYNREAVEDLLFRIRSKLPATQKAYTFFVAGRQKEQTKQIDQAITAYVNGLEVNRNDPTGFLLLARLYEEKGEIRDAIDRLHKARQTPKRSLDAALNLARLYARRYQLDEARQMIKEAQDVGAALRSGGGNPKADQVNFLQALIALQQKRPELANPFLEKALRSGSRFADLYIQMGNLEVEKKNEKLAEFYYSVALRYEPFHPKAMLGVALARFHLDSPSRAVAFLKDKLAAQPNSAAIMTNLAIIYLRSGDQDAGKNYLQNSIRSDSRYADAFRLLGDLTKEEGNRQTDFTARRHSYRYALASYEMYSKLAPNDPEGFRATGDLYFDIRDLGAAAKNYYKVIELTPNYPDIRLRLAQISRNGNDGPAAMRHLEDELRINPRSDAAMVEKGNIYMAQKEFDLATKAFTEAARVNEKNADALFGLGVVYHLQGSYDNALSLFARVIKLDPLKADVFWQMGLIYQKLNNQAKAVQAFTDYKGIVRDPSLVGKAEEKLRELQR